MRKFDPQVYELAAEIAVSCSSDRGGKHFDKYTCCIISRILEGESNRNAHIAAYQDMFRPEPWDGAHWWNGKLSYEHQLARAIACDLAALMAEDGVL